MYFANVFRRILDEAVNEMTTGSVGMGGTATDTFSSDFYAPGDARIPGILGTVKKKRHLNRIRLEELYG